MKIKNNSKLLSMSVILVTCMVLTTAHWAEVVGKSLFVYGEVQLHQSTGEISPLTKGMELNDGDRVITGINGRSQLQMSDGAIFDLRPNTEFLISEYQFEASEIDGAQVASDDSKGFYKLLRGGFRTISGLIGKKNKKNYKVTTPVATIGIRGTDYTLQLCIANCEAGGVAAPAGLYASVLEGGIDLGNAAGSLDLDPGQIGFVADASTAPTLTSSNVTTTVKSENPPTARNNLIGIDEQDNEVDLETGVTPPQTSVRGAFAALGSSGLVIGDLERSVTSQAVNSFRAEDGSLYETGEAESINRGVDASTGLYWGRWTTGLAQVTTAAGETSEFETNTNPLHWIHASNQIKPELPLSGTANFLLVGNTDPTDTLGNTGTVGSANLTADFTSQTVDADVNLSINQQTWDASAQDVALDGDAATFSGEFDTVTVTNDRTGEQNDGQGRLDGFFSADDDGELNGAGVTYNLSDEDDVVEGALAFELDKSEGEPNP